MRKFGVAALLALFPLLAVWWVSVDLILDALRPLVSWLAQQLMPVSAIAPRPGANWLVQTSMMVTAGKTAAGTSVATFTIEGSLLRRLTLAWPLFVALIVAPPRPRYLARRAVLGLVALAVLFVLSACALAFLDLVVVVNHTSASDTELPPAIYVGWPAYSHAVVFLAKLARYVAIDVAPLLAPPVLWATLNPVARQTLIGFSDPASLGP